MTSYAARQKFKTLPRHQQGAGLIEVMVAVLVMGVGLLGIAAMQATALRNNESSLERSQATILTYSILDAMRANRTEALKSKYDLAETCDKPTYAGTLTLAQKDITEWFGDMQKAIGESEETCATIESDGNQFTVTIRWDDSRASDDVETAAPIDPSGDEPRRNKVVTVVNL
ncbi:MULTISPECIES: type IV pilus modification protein PilV [unclassified Pseudoxanthomonas]|uniref:type IV pilus modification protein PilV n=1 Tax=unclassified Pseudoxanthomonas TaxID=2645906 RepID=UPI0030786D21